MLSNRLNLKPVPQADQAKARLPEPSHGVGPGGRVGKKSPHLWKVLSLFYKSFPRSPASFPYMWYHCIGWPPCIPVLCVGTSSAVYRNSLFEKGYSEIEREREMERVL